MALSSPLKSQPLLALSMCIGNLKCRGMIAAFKGDTQLVTNREMRAVSRRWKL